MFQDEEPSQRLLVIAPHPDDEVLGAGGTIARFSAAGSEVTVVCVTRGQPPRFEAAFVDQVRAEAKVAHEILGVAETIFLDHPAAEMDQVAHAEVNQSIGETVKRVDPDMIMLPFAGDIHLDHQLIFLSAMVAARPSRAAYPRRLLAYETLSETNWHAPGVAPGFQPNVFIDIAATLECKIEAMRAYQSQNYDFPHERSLESIRALATSRGCTVHRTAAEAFMLIRHVV